MTFGPCRPFKMPRHLRQASIRCDRASHGVREWGLVSPAFAPLAPEAEANIDFQEGTEKMSNFAHGREAERIPSDLLLEFRVPGSRTRGTGHVRDLSNTGARFITYQNLKPGTNIQIRIPSANKDRPPLMRPAQVVRCRQVAGGEGYAVACAFD